MIQALAITAWMADLLTNCAFTALKINVLEANAASAMGPGSILAERSSGALARISAQLVRGTDRRVGRARLWVGCAR